MRIQGRGQLLSSLLTVVVPLFIVANIACFVPIYEWLHAMDRQVSASDEHLNWWFFAMLTLCIGGILFAGSAKKLYLKFTYWVLLVVLVLLVMFMGAMAGAGQGVKT